MAFMDHIHTCNEHDITKFVPFVTAMGVQVGWIRIDHLKCLEDYSSVFKVGKTKVSLVRELQAHEEITNEMAKVCEDLHAKGLIENWRDEAYGVTERFGDTALFEVERAASSFFGVRAYGVHLNGYVRDEKGLKLWVGQRAQDRAICPGMLDNMVAGGQPADLTLGENLIKECGEEADISASLANQAISVGSISYVMESDKGLKPDTMFCYDLEVPADFIPVNTDGETERFFLWPVEEVAKIINEGGNFKFNCNLVIIDFLIRHGVLNPDETPDYAELVKGLHR